MKMITAIVNKKDTPFVCDALREAGIYFTKMASTGGFLRAGNSTLLIGVEDARLEETLDIIRTHCARRMEPAPLPSANAGTVHMPVSARAMVPVGGATVFVTDITHFEKM